MVQDSCLPCLMGRRWLGLTFIELLVVVALVGILAGLGLTQLNFVGAATRQAAQVVSANVNRARLEAIRSNGTVGIEIVAASDAFPSGYLRICGVADGANACEAFSDGTSDGTVRFVDMGEGELARARINDTTTVLFDRRGVVRNLGNVATVGITGLGGGNGRTLSIEITGRVTVQ